MVYRSSFIQGRCSYNKVALFGPLGPSQRRGIDDMFCCDVGVADMCGILCAPVSSFSFHFLQAVVISLVCFFNVTLVTPVRLMLYKSGAGIYSLKKQSC